MFANVIFHFYRAHREGNMLLGGGFMIVIISKGIVRK